MSALAVPARHAGLDHLLGRFLDVGYAEPDAGVFERLLGQQDTLLRDWFMSRAEAPDPKLAAMVARIVEVARVRPPTSVPSGQD